DGKVCVAARATPANTTAPGASPFALASSSSTTGVAPGGASTQGSCPVKMALLPAGSFRMGERGDSVTVGAFCMDITEVTVDAYAACVRSGACAEDGIACPHALYGSKDSRERPINCVTADQAQRYCAAKGKRLPTEEEWEWAARGG